MKKFANVLCFTACIVFGVITFLNLFKGFFGETEVAKHDGYVMSIICGIPFIVFCVLIIKLQKIWKTKIKDFFCNIFKDILNIIGSMFGWLLLIGGGLIGLVGLYGLADDFLFAISFCIGGGVAFFIGMFLIELIGINEEKPYTPIKIENNHTIKPIHPKPSLIKVEETCKGCGAPLKGHTCDYCGRTKGNYRKIY